MSNKIVRNSIWQCLLIVTLLFTFNLSVQAAVPDNVDYQGYLTDSGGSPVNGTVSITFHLYNIDTGGITLWSDTQSVTVTNGLFNVKLGNPGTPFPVGLFDTPLYIGINVAGDGEMVPRVAMSSSGFAHKADDADTVGGQSAASLDQSAHVSDTSNPHSVTAAQTGAVSSATFTLHTGDASAHHTKTTSFTDLTDQAADAQLPAVMTRDTEIMPTVLANDGTGSTLDADTIDGINSSALEESAEIDADISIHASNASVHHAKTSNFTELSGQASDAQVPAGIARDAEIMPTVLVNDGTGSTLDADLLDGLNSNAFMSAGTDNWVNITGDTMTGNLGVLARVGIGTAVPVYGLDVRGGVGNYLGYFNNDNNGSGSAYGLYASADARDTGTGLGRGAYFRGLGGSTSGTAYGSMHYAYAYGASTAYGVYSDADGGTTTGPEWAFYGLGDSYFSGDVGIGTNNPASKLAVSGGATVGSAYNASTLSDGNLAIAGNVGIGTATPSYDLEVRGGASAYLAYFNNDNNATGNAAGLYANGDARDTGTGWGYGGTFSAHGGNTSGNAYASRNYAYANGTSSAYGVYSDADGGTTTGREWSFYGLGDGYFSGDVGIGTSAPSSQLDVVDVQDFNIIAEFRNTSTGFFADGILIQLGITSDLLSTANQLIQFKNGNDTLIGSISGNPFGGVLYNTTSDARLKTNIVDFTGGLDMVSRIKVRQYEFIAAPGKQTIGFLAQELQAVLPQAVSGDPDGDVETDPMGVAYGSITPILASAIQEQNSTIQEQAANIQKLIEKNTALEERLSLLEARLGN